MNDDELTVPTARQCFAEAYRLMRSGGDVERAGMWLAMAREIREDAMMRRMRMPLPQAVTVTRSVNGIVEAQPEPEQPKNQMVGYEQGQVLPPTQGQHDYAMKVREALLSGLAVDAVLPGLAEDDRDAIHDLVNEIRSRYRAEQPITETLVRPYVPSSVDTFTRTAPSGWGATDSGSFFKQPLDDTAILGPRTPAPPIEGAEGQCRNHDEGNRLIVRHGKWVHYGTLEAICPIPGQSPEGDETYHRFANPL